MTTVAFGNRLAAEFAAGRHLCAGIDPHAPLLADWGLSDDAAGAERMGRDVVAAAAGVAACVKPQIAFFERFGSAGFAALERVLADARAAGLAVVADVKRGDIGSSFAAYADAWLTPGSPLEVDAMTVVAYQGFGTLDGAFGHVREHGKGLFVLAATSNPEARPVQTAVRTDGSTVANAMVGDAAAWNLAHDPTAQVGSIGVVLGATLVLDEFGIDPSVRPAGPALPVLAPGFGFQGAQIERARDIFGGLGDAILANESRSVLAGGADGLAARVRDRANAIAEALKG
ncbi:orotidine 5'-phosphate decarboxylase [Leucobacter sp. OLIS6]|uniref:orotidine-5'-phosphate decarboxylase n=1 Tax=unclassified Leucobacter TaxID=2621730 RepID=UPI000C17A848|nr:MULTISPECIES: orotidine-5'-phosphate decarboxylase [unclassified Leucobacter]PIJ20751.1 orotidine 5'-phosphate decarboxylase [Leucobacter sp. OLES1]PII81600.1 orotidine 5'-phosphate decarboxylase [Leucobacter sp. OLCALW19]PII86271.1 orotidine 5'-phosphate decarboxylase [Leucobacter sp. OLTLW20]PII90166.1 orotidine 5'-phosphate decarboxylase [Leucobacter sp. OLAS13]PII97199.1 orotidine 5'-phosphate decarboxylase [Leucobacter sp. OLDS2]